MAVVYNERLIIEYAARLYRRAITTVALHVLFGGVFGALIERNTRALATALGRALPPPTPRDA